MMRYVANFARNGNPNSDGQVAWPAYTLEKKERLYFDDPITVRPLSEDESSDINGSRPAQ
jgi:carboxylesterase type B